MITDMCRRALLRRASPSSHYEASLAMIASAAAYRSVRARTCLLQRAESALVLHTTCNYVTHNATPTHAMQHPTCNTVRTHDMPLVCCSCSGECLGLLQAGDRSDARARALLCVRPYVVEPRARSLMLRESMRALAWCGTHTAARRLRPTAASSRRSSAHMR